jgi:hypothetical protein
MLQREHHEQAIDPILIFFRKVSMNKDQVNQILAYYSVSGQMCDLGEYTALARELAGEPAALVKVLQGLVIHIFWAERYGVKLSEERQAEVQIRSVQPKLVRLFQLDPRPMSMARPPELRLVGNCRDFSLLLAALLKAHGIPARPRCGFGTYFMPGHFEDHWMTEYWNAVEGRWVQVDAQLDPLQVQALGVQFNPLDMPAGQFVLAGEAWKMCRAGQANPDDFGIFQWKGWDFIRGNVMRDFLALNKVVVLPWDSWQATASACAEFTPAQWDEMDRISDLTLLGNDGFEQVRALYQENLIFHFTES